MAKMGVQKLMVAVSLMIVLAMACGPMRASCTSFITYSGPGCSNYGRQYSACGCSNIASDTHGGYIFMYQGQTETAAAYNTADCQGVPHTRFSVSTTGCSPFGWQSFFIQCHTGSKTPGSKTPAIAASISVAAIVVLIALCAILVWHRRRKAIKKTGKKEVRRQASWPEHVMQTKARVFSLQELEDATRHFHSDNKLGEGGYGSVYKEIQGRAPTLPSIFQLRP